MEDDILDQLKGRSLQEFVDTTNSKFYNWLKRVLLLNPSRVVQLSTYLLNLNIAHKYFSWLNTLIREIPDLMPEDLTSEKIREFTIDTEKIYGLFILLSMKFKSLDMLTIEETDSVIDGLHRYGPLVEQFFVFNSMDPELYNKDLIDLVTYTKDYAEMDKMFPDLSFDPLFQDVIDNEAVKQLFDTSYITDFFNLMPPKELKYIPHKNLLEKSFQADKNTVLFQVSPELSISRFFRESLNYFGVTFLGSHEQFDDIIYAFQKYYEVRVSSKKEEIKEFLPCFGELLKLAEILLYKKYKFTTLKKRLISKIPQNIVNKFLKKFCLFRPNLSFPSDYPSFEAILFLDQYNEYFPYAFFVGLSA